MSNQRWAGIAVGVLGLGAVGTGAYFGLHAIDKDHQSDADCRNPPTGCTADARTLSSDAKASADRATVLMIAGGLAVGTGIVLFATGAPRIAKRASTGSLTLIPYYEGIPLHGSAGIGVRGQF